MNNSPYKVEQGDQWAPSRADAYFRVEIKPGAYGLGVFAGEPIPARAVILKDGGTVVSSVEDVSADKAYAVLIARDIYLAPNDYSDPDPFWLMNHSCNPNVMRIGGLIYVARRNISVGEQLTIDYAPLLAGRADWTLACRCGDERCRKIITGNDWKSEVLSAALWEEWLPHIQRDIMQSRSARDLGAGRLDRRRGGLRRRVLRGRWSG